MKARRLIEGLTHVSIEVQLLIFLMLMAQKQNIHARQEDWQHSVETIKWYYNLVLRAVCSL